MFFFLFLSIDVLSMWYCLPDSLSYFSCNPETASRVTLASLGTVFQTALTVLLRLRLARHVQNLSRITRMRRICSFHGFFLSDLYAPVGCWDFPGLSLAWYCVPDSSYCALSPSALSPCSKSITDKRMRRICSFHGFFSFGFVCACRALGFSRIITCSVLCSRLISCFVV